MTGGPLPHPQQPLDQFAGLGARQTFHRCLVAVLGEPQPPPLAAMAELGGQVEQECHLRVGGHVPRASTAPCWAHRSRRSTTIRASCGVSCSPLWMFSQFRWCCDPAGTSPNPPQCVQRSDASLRLEPYPLQCSHTLKPCAAGSSINTVSCSFFDSLGAIPNARPSEARRPAHYPAASSSGACSGSPLCLRSNSCSASTSPALKSPSGSAAISSRDSAIRSRVSWSS